jgi:hypothetical protein
MERPEAYLRALAAPLAQGQEGSPLPVARFSLDAVANAFVILGLLPAARAEEILTEQRPALQAAGIRLLVGRRIGELSVTRGAHVLQEARAAAPGGLRRIPLASGAGPVRCQLRSHDLTIASATLTPEGISVRYRGDPREGDDHAARGWGKEIMGEITGLSVTDDIGRTYLVPAGKVGGHVSGRRTVSGGTLWVPEGEFLAVPAPGETGSGGSRAAARWLEFSSRPGQPARVEIGPSAAAVTGTADPPWPTPAECYLAQFAPPARDWSLGYSAIGTAELNTVELDTAAIVTAVIDALLTIGTLPPDSAVLAGLRDSVCSDRRPAPSDRRPSPRDRQRALRDTWAPPGQASSAGLAARLPFERATAVIEGVTAREDVVSVQLYGYPWVDEPWPMIAPCFQVTAVDDTGAEHQGRPGDSSRSPAHEGSGSFWFWPPVDPQAKQLRVTVSTLREAAWALIDIPGR